MNRREQLLTVLRGGQADRTPWYADLSWWHAAHKAKGTLPAHYVATGATDAAATAEERGYLRLHQETGAGIYLYAPQVWREEYDDTVTVTERQEGNLTHTTLATPLGRLTSTREYLPDSHTSAYRVHFIKQPADLRVMRYLWEHRAIRPDAGEFVRYDRFWGADGIPVCLAPICTSPLQTLITRWAGITTTVQLAADAPAEFAQTLAALEAADDAIFVAILAAPVSIVEFPDNLHGQVTGKRLMRQYALPYWRKRIAQLHTRDILVGIHNDGASRAALPVLIEAGFDFVESVTPAPFGDVSLAEIRAVTAGKIIVFGGIPGLLFSRVYPRAEFEALVRRALATFPRGREFVLGVADQVPPDAEFARIGRVRELVEQQAA